MASRRSARRSVLPGKRRLRAGGSTGASIYWRLCNVDDTPAVRYAASFRDSNPSSVSPKMSAGEQLLQQEAFEKCWAHSLLRAVLHCHSPGVATAATVARRLRIDVHDDDDDNDNA